MADSDCKRCSRCGSVFPLSNFYKQGRARYCIPCEKAYKKEHYAKNADKIREKTRQWQHANKERKAAADKAYRQANHEKVAAKSREWAAKNPEKRKEIWQRSRENNLDRARENEAAYRARNREVCNMRIRMWKQLNKEKITFYAGRRRSATSKAIPAWTDESKVIAFYKQAQELSVSTGRQHHVDHIVPLLSNIVCGLHCEANLRVVDWKENLSKGNRRWPDMP